MSAAAKPRRRAGRLALKLGVSLATFFVLLEAALHLFPAFVPASYRRTFPLHGVGFFQPELLARTTLRAVPLPLYVGAYSGVPPADLVEYGVAPESAARLDRERWPRVRVPVDALGLPNASLPARADIVLVGDSFLVSGGGIEPEGLTPLLAKATGEVVYDLGVSAIGPFQERSLLLDQGLPKQPALVVWFFFGGNDLNDVLTTLYQESLGHATWADVHADQRPPRWRVPAVARFLFGRKRDRAAQPAPLAPFLLPRPDGAPTPLWFHPNYLLALTRSRAEWEADRAWPATRQVLETMRDEVRAAGAQPLLVYLPSKAQAYLPFVEADAPLAFAAANFRRKVSAHSAETLLPLALRHRSALEELLSETCALLDIPFSSASPSLEALAARGELGYLVADTHWDMAGQAAFLPALLAALEELRAR